MIKDLNPQQPQQPQLTEEMVESGTDLKCPSCDGIFFYTAVRYKRISKIVLATPQDGLVPIPTVRCADCGEIIDMEEAMKRAGKEKEE